MAEFGATLSSNPNVDYARQIDRAIDKINAPASTKGQDIDVALKGLGQGVDSLFTLADNHITKDIKEDVTGDVNNARGAQGGDLADNVFPRPLNADKSYSPDGGDPSGSQGTRVGGAGGSGIGTIPPTDSKQYQGKLSDLDAAYKAGTISNTYYYTNLDAITRQIKAKYPGYNDQVDQIVHQVTGVQPANALRASILSDLATAQSEAEKKTNSWDTYEKQYQAQLPVDYRLPNGQVNPKWADHDQVKNYVMKGLQYENGISVQRSELALSSAQGEQKQKDAESVATNEVSSRVNRWLSDSTDATGFKGINDDIMQMQKAGGGTPEQQQALKLHFAQAKAALEMQVDGVFNKPLVDGKTDTYASILRDPNKLLAIKKQAMAPLDAMESLISGEQYGLVTMAANRNKATTDQAVGNLFAKDKSMSLLSGLRAIGGDQLATSIYARPESGLLDRTSTAIRDLLINKAAVQGGGDISKDFPEGMAATKDKQGNYNPQLVKATVGAYATALSDPKVSDQIATNVAKEMFKPENNGFLSNFSTTRDRLSVFSQLTSPAVTQRMAKLSESDPTIWQNYKSWAADKFVGIFKTTGTDIGQNLRQANSQLEITFNDKTNQFETRPRPPLQGIIPDPVGVATVTQRVNDINRGLKVMEPIIKRDGGDVSKEIGGLLTGLGIDPNQPKDGSPFSGAFKYLKGKLTPTGGSGSVWDGVTGNPTEPQGQPGGINLDAPYTSAEASMRGRRDASEGGKLLPYSGDVGAPGGAAKVILEHIHTAEGAGYNTVFRGRQLPLHTMTVNQVQELQRKMTSLGSPSTAVGANQILASTLSGVKKSLGLTGEELFTPELQDRIGHALLKARGYDEFKAGRMSADEFQNNLAREWAAIPRSDTGQSHYEGDGINHATVNRRVTGRVLQSAM